MQISLDEEQENEIKVLVSSAIKNGIQQATNRRPYLNRKDIAKYFGVAESTIGYWASIGMPVAKIGSRKLYGKETITDWLRAHEQRKNGHIKQTKKPATIALVTSTK